MEANKRIYKDCKKKIIVGIQQIKYDECKGYFMNSHFTNMPIYFDSLGDFILKIYLYASPNSVLERLDINMLCNPLSRAKYYFFLEELHIKSHSLCGRVHGTNNGGIEKRFQNELELLRIMTDTLKISNDPLYWGDNKMNEG